MNKISDIMTYDEFLERYLINKEEFKFYYKNKIVNICYGEKGMFTYNIVENNVVILYKAFNSPKELLDNMECFRIKLNDLMTKNAIINNY